jgi:hypothetical protein
MLLIAPFQAIIFGHSQQGKTTLVLEIIKQISKLCINTRFKTIKYFYAVWDEKFENFPNVEFIKGPPGEIENTGEHHLLIADDFMDDKSAMSRLTSLYLKESHHFRCSCIVIVHSLFHPNLRQISLNCKVFILFPSMRDKNPVNAFFKQIDYPTAFLKQIYTAAVSKKYSFLVINLQRDIPQLLRFSTDIFSESPCYLVPAGTFMGKPIEINLNE